MSAADPVAALVAYLKADAGLAALLGAQVFGGELPAGEAISMPRKALVVKPSGGTSLTAGSFAEHDTGRFDLFGFGETPHEAARVADAGALAMKRLRRGVWAGTLLHWARSAGGASSGREPGTEWPRSFRSYQLFYALEEV